MSGTAVLFISFFVLLFLNVPIFASIGLSVMAYIFASGGITWNMVGTTMFTACDSFPLMAIPLFILAGALMESGGLSKRLVGFADSLVGHLPGGLAIVTVLSCMFFGAISGSAAATVATIGVIMVPSMIERGYSKGFSYALIASAGCLGVIIPPSITMVTYGVATNASIPTLFMGGFGPGIIVGGCLIAYSVVYSIRHGYKGNGQKPSLRHIVEEFVHAIGALMVPIIILGGIYGGFFTPTEAAVIAVFYGLMVGLFFYRELNLKKSVDALVSSAVTTGTIMLIVGAATVLARVLTLEQIPAAISNFIMGMTDNKYVVLLIINLVLLVVGCVMDSTPAILILAPILYPIAASYGVNIIHFGLIMTLNVCIGFMTPPVGLNLFVACSIGDIKFSTLVKNIWPFLITMLVALMLTTYVEPIAMFIPRLFGYGG